LSPGLNPYWLVAVSWNINDWMGNTSTNIPHKSKKKRKQKKKPFTAVVSTEGANQKNAILGIF
jgi:hypothetical protein